MYPSPPDNTNIVFFWPAFTSDIGSGDVDVSVDGPGLDNTPLTPLVGAPADQCKCLNINFIFIISLCFNRNCIAQQPATTNVSAGHLNPPYPLTLHPEGKGSEVTNEFVILFCFKPFFGTFWKSYYEGATNIHIFLSGTEEGGQW